MEGAASNHSAEMIRLGLAGDAMLGRLVDRHVLANPATRPAYVWGNTLPLWRQMDLRMVNLECVIATTGEPWVPKTFHFRGGPRAIDALETAGIQLVSLANNHVLDFGAEALRECLGRLRRASIRYAGAGETSAEAVAPAMLTAGGITLAVVALTDGEPEWEATPDRPGTAYVRCDPGGLAEPYRTRVARTLAQARAAAHLVVVSAHVGSNWGPPTAQTRALAHQLIDLGADLYWGHSNHTVQGIEIYRGRPILYSCGDFIDDYAVDPVERNDLSCLFELQIEHTNVSRILLHPVRIARFQVNHAGSEDARWLCTRLIERMAEFGTQVTRAGDLLAVSVDA